MKISRIKNAPIRGIDSFSKSQPLKKAPNPVSTPKVSTPSKVSASGGSFNFKSEIALDSSGLGSSASLKSTPASVKSLNLDDLQILQDAQSFEAPKTKSSGVEKLNFKMPASVGKPAFVYSSGCPCG